MAEQVKPREFWLQKADLDFDLNWRKIFAAEFPHKDTLGENALHVIEYSAYKELKKELERMDASFIKEFNASAEAEYKVDKLTEQNKIMREALEVIRGIPEQNLPTADAVIADRALARCEGTKLNGESK